VHLAGYVPDVGDPTTGTAFPALTVIDLKDVVSEDPTPGFEAVFWAGPEGPQGPIGLTGPEGPEGPQGIPGPSSAISVIDNGDGTLTLDGISLTDNLDGTLTIGA